MIVDEAQNLTPHEVKTIITRAGEGTKIILTGDPYQIDHPYLDSSNNGLTTVAERFKNEAIAGPRDPDEGRALAARRAGHADPVSLAVRPTGRRARGPMVVVAVALGLTLGGVRGEAQRQPGWEVRVPERVELAPGEGGTIALSIAVDRGLSVSRDAAVIVDLEAPAAVTFKRRRLGRGDAVDPGADAPRFAIPVQAGEPGEHVVKLRLRFWVCGGKACRPIDVKRSTLLAVVPPPPPDAAVDAPPPPDRTR